MKKNIKRLLENYGIFIIILIGVLYSIAKVFTQNGIISTLIYDIYYSFLGLNFYESFLLIIPLVPFVLYGLLFPIWVLFKKNNKLVSSSISFYAVFLIMLALVAYVYISANLNLQLGSDYDPDSNNFQVNRIAHAGGDKWVFIYE